YRRRRGSRPRQSTARPLVWRGGAFHAWAWPEGRCCLKRENESWQWESESAHSTRKPKKPWIGGSERLVPTPNLVSEVDYREELHLKRQPADFVSQKLRQTHGIPAPDSAAMHETPFCHKLASAKGLGASHASGGVIG